MTSTADSPIRPLRRDAARNRALLLEAGRAVFAERGLDATLDDIAHRAGVGVGTAYRHFANKQELAAAIFHDDFTQLVGAAREALEVDDPWEALVGFIETTAAKQAKDRGFYEIATAPGGFGDPQTVKVDHGSATVREALIEPVTVLIERAKSAGCLRADAEAGDIAALLFMMGSVYEVSDIVGREVWRRYLWLLLDGLRAGDRPLLPCHALGVDELEAVMIAKKH